PSALSLPAELSHTPLVFDQGRLASPHLRVIGLTEAVLRILIHSRVARIRRWKRIGDPMKLLVIGSGMMGSAAAYDMARAPQVKSVTLADNDSRRAREVAARINRIAGDKKVRAATLDASDEKAAAKLMRGHDAALSAVPYFLNLGLAKAAVEARCHFADLGGNNTIVREELAMAKKAEKRGVALAPDCGLSPGMASILGGELVRRL